MIGVVGVVRAVQVASLVGVVGWLGCQSWGNVDNTVLWLCSGNLRQFQAMMAKYRNLMSLSKKDIVHQQIWNDFSMDTTSRKVVIFYLKSKNPSCVFYLMICRLHIFNMLMCEVLCKSHMVLPSSLLSEWQPFKSESPKVHFLHGSRNLHSLAFNTSSLLSFHFQSVILTQTHDFFPAEYSSVRLVFYPSIERTQFTNHMRIKVQFQNFNHSTIIKRDECSASKFWFNTILNDSTNLYR